MADDKKLQQELDELKARFMSLPTIEEEEAFRAEMEKYVEGKTKEEREVLSDLFLKGAEEACENAEKAYDDTLRAMLDNIYACVSWSYVADHYFHKSRSWLCQRLNGLKIHNKEARFTAEEKQTLVEALLDMSAQIKDTAHVIEHL